MRRLPRTVWHRLPDGLKQQIIEEFTDIFKEVCHEHIPDYSPQSPRPPRRRLRPPIEPTYPFTVWHCHLRITPIYFYYDDANATRPGVFVEHGFA